VTGAADGLDALRVLEQSEPSLVIFDLQLPRMDGRALLHELRQRWPHVGVLLMTGTEDVRRAAIELEVTAYVAKPFDLEELIQLVRRQLSQSA
jgi:DNA-binding response OmpR family regulator